MDSAEDLDFLRHICINGTENKFGAKKKQED